MLFRFGKDGGFKAQRSAVLWPLSELLGESVERGGGAFLHIVVEISAFANVLENVGVIGAHVAQHRGLVFGHAAHRDRIEIAIGTGRSEEHTSELKSLMRLSNAVLCLNNKKCK